MLIGTSQGQGFRYEILEHHDGYVVHMRDLDTGMVEETESKLFRTAAVAFRYAETSAAFDRLAAARISGEPTEQLASELQTMQELYRELSQRLGDEGMAAHMLVSWEANAAVAERRRYH